MTLVFMAGGLAGQRQLERIDSGNGESQRADRVVQRAFAAKADENVLVQGLGGVRAHDPAFTAALRDVQGRLTATSHVFDVRAPIGRANAGQLSHDGRSAVVSFSIRGGERTWERRVGPVLDATAAAQRAHPHVRIEQFGEASATARSTRHSRTTSARRRSRRCR